MRDLGSELKAYFEETTEPLAVEDVLDRGTIVVSGGSDPHRHPRRLRPSGPLLAVAVALTAVAVFVGISSMVGGPGDVAGVDSAEAARAAIGELYRALEEEDVEAIGAFFGDSVVFTSYLGIEMVGPEAATYHVRTIMVPMTVLEVGEPEQRDDGSFSIVVEVQADTHRVPWMELYHVVMDGPRVVSIEHEGNIAASPPSDPFADLGQ